MNESIYHNISEETLEKQANFFLSALDSLQDINIALLEELIMDNNYNDRQDRLLDRYLGYLSILPDDSLRTMEDNINDKHYMYRTSPII